MTDLREGQEVTLRDADGVVRTVEVMDVDQDAFSYVMPGDSDRTWAYSAWIIPAADPA